MFKLNAAAILVFLSATQIQIPDKTDLREDALRTPATAFERCLAMPFNRITPGLTTTASTMSMKVSNLLSRCSCSTASPPGVISIVT